MSKPNKTAVDYVVIALSPALIIGLVGSLCFFLIEVFYRGRMDADVRWVMFWYVLATVLISRIGIEQSPQYAAMYGVALALATWIHMIRTQPAYLLAIVLLAVVWFCAHKLVWDCTLIDEEGDSSGQGLLQSAPIVAGEVKPAALKSAKGPKPASPMREVAAKRPKGAAAPGRWVIYFSLAALPLFGIGQMLLPGGDVVGRRRGFELLMLYLASGLGLLVTTSFLGLRRYLRQRYLTMPPMIAVGWLKYGVGVAAAVLALAVFLPRPGSRDAWIELKYRIDYQLRQASKYASRRNSPGKGEGREGTDAGNGQKAQAPGTKGEPNRPKEPGQGQPVPAPGPGQTPGTTPQPGEVYNFLHTAILVAGCVLLAVWLYRWRHLLLEMWRSLVAAAADFWRRLMAFGDVRKPAKREAPVPRRPRYRAFAQYKNPFFTGKEEAWPAEQILIYSYEAVQVWAKERGIDFDPARTPREFCRELTGRLPDMEGLFQPLAFLYAHAAYGKKLPPGSDLEPIKELWRQMAVPPARTAAMAHG